MMATDKRCAKCDEVKPAALFSRKSDTADGLRSQCKACQSSEGKAYYAANSEAVGLTQGIYRRNNPEKLAAKQRRYLTRHPEAGRAAMRRHRERHKDDPKKPKTPEQKLMTRVYSAKYAKNHPEYQRDWLLKSKYNLTRSDVADMLVNQGGVCLICARTLSKPYVDHCHSTGKVRGLLCNGCNRLLGWYEKNAERIAKYLEV